MWAKSLGSAELALVLVACLGASLCCSHAQEPPAQPPAPCTSAEPLRVAVRASPRINPGETGEALATVVRLYQLKTTTKLSGLSFDDLVDHERDALGDDFINVQEVTVNPGERVTPPMIRNPDAGYLAAAALFREPTGVGWRAFVKLSPPDPQHCHHDQTAVVQYLLDENRIELR